jgi:hypothetical protein
MDARVVTLPAEHRRVADVVACRQDGTVASISDRPSSPGGFILAHAAHDRVGLSRWDRAGDPDAPGSNVRRHTAGVADDLAAPPQGDLRVGVASTEGDRGWRTHLIGSRSPEGRHHGGAGTTTSSYANAISREETGYDI